MIPRRILLILLIVSICVIALTIVGLIYVFVISPSITPPPPNQYYDCIQNTCQKVPYQTQYTQPTDCGCENRMFYGDKVQIQNSSTQKLLNYKNLEIRDSQGHIPVPPQPVEKSFTLWIEDQPFGIKNNQLVVPGNSAQPLQLDSYIFDENTQIRVGDAFLDQNFNLCSKCTQIFQFQQTN